MTWILCGKLCDKFFTVLFQKLEHIDLSASCTQLIACLSCLCSLLGLPHQTETSLEVLGLDSTYPSFSTAAQTQSCWLLHLLFWILVGHQTELFWCLQPGISLYSFFSGGWAEGTHKKVCKHDQSWPTGYMKVIIKCREGQFFVLYNLQDGN